mmetsp:Transcript_4811/g.30524  ORF Transcript_4811/g.30524 Transcript_4811/m.30524 type:complete len:354 (+) Transcript_4811:2563-3624(+)
MKHAKTSLLRVWLFRPSQAMERGARIGNTNVLGLGSLPVESTRSKQDKQLARDQEKAWADLLMRTSLSRTCEGLVPPEAFVFAREPRGKPKVDWEHTLFRAGLPNHCALPGRVAFNMTHTNGMMACATLYHAHEPWEGSLLTVGIDLESIQRRPRKGVETLARRRLAGPEAEWILQSATEEGKVQRFLEIWTLKEAYLKATGDGLSSGLGLKKFCISFQDDIDATVAGAGQDPETNFATGMKSSKGARRMHIQHEAIQAKNHANGRTVLTAESGGSPGYVGDASAEGWQSVLFEVEQTHLLALCYNLQWSKGAPTGLMPLTSHPTNCNLELVSTVPLLGPDKNVDSRMLASTL